MKRKDNSILKKIGRDYMILPLSDHNVSVDVILKTNEIGALIYNCLEEETTVEDIVDAILEQYEVERYVCLNDVNEFIESMKEKGLI